MSMRNGPTNSPQLKEPSRLQDVGDRYISRRGAGRNHIISLIRQDSWQGHEGRQGTQPAVPDT